MPKQASYKSVCVPVEEKQNLKNLKHILPAPTLGMDNFFLSLSFIYVPVARQMIRYVTVYHIELLDFFLKKER